MARKLGWLLLLMFAGTSAFAAEVGAISGTVKDSSGTPQMGALVEIFTSAATLGSTVLTDARGLYSAENLPPGKYLLQIKAQGFKLYELNGIELASSETRDLGKLDYCSGMRR